MSLDTLTSDDKLKIKQTVLAGKDVLHDLDILKETLKDVVANLAEELEVKPKVINQAIKLAHKNEKENAIDRAHQDMTDVDIILDAAGEL